MAGRRKKHSSRVVFDERDILTFISLSISLIAYSVNVRPKLGDYFNGIIDCALIVGVVIYLHKKLRIKRS